MERRHTSTCCAARIERAKDLLRSTGLSVTEVSLEVGFRSLGSFSTAFRDLVGESPSEYAHRWRAAGAPRDDCQKTYAELNERGVNFLSEPTERFYGIEATLRDNSGNWFSMTQRSETDREGITVTPDGDEVELTVPLNLAFGNPALLRAIGLTPVLRSLGAERQYKNDEQIDNSLRSVLFQVPKPGVSDPAACGSPVVSPDCFTGVQDLGAIDIQRGRDHGMPSYNDLAEPTASGRSAVRRHHGRSDRQPPERRNDRRSPHPRLRPAPRRRWECRPAGRRPQEDAVAGIRRTTLAARLKATYGSPERLDAFVGMVSEQHVPGTEFGELQLAIWKRQFQALRDGDRFFYLSDPRLGEIRRQYGLDFRRTLASIIRLNTGNALRANVFEAPPASSDTATSVSRAAPASHRRIHSADPGRMRGEGGCPGWRLRATWSTTSMRRSPSTRTGSASAWSAGWARPLRSSRLATSRSG